MEYFEEVWLDCVPYIGHEKRKQILSVFNDAKTLHDMLFAGRGKEEAVERLGDISGLVSRDIKSIVDEEYRNRIYEKYKKYKSDGIRITSYNSPDYPESLRTIYSPPYILYYRGRLPEPGRKRVAIVGSRDCSEYGRRMAGNIASELAGAGVDVISGFARGVDTAAHNGALAGKGDTYAVFGCGINTCYPRENTFMYEDIVKNGGVMSEFSPDTPIRAGLFPLRNRIISGLSDLVIVVEAGKKSGALNTVSHALEQNKNVMALPGRASDRMSVGCNELIKQGAGIITNMDDIFFELGVFCEKNVKFDHKIKNNLATKEKMLYSLLDFNPKSIDEIVIAGGLDATETLQILVKLELYGLAKEMGKNHYIRGDDMFV